MEKIECKKIRVKRVKRKVAVEYVEMGKPDTKLLCSYILKRLRKEVI